MKKLFLTSSFVILSMCIFAQTPAQTAPAKKAAPAKEAKPAPSQKQEAGDPQQNPHHLNDTVDIQDAATGKIIRQVTYSDGSKKEIPIPPKKEEPKKSSSAPAKKENPKN